MVDDETFGVLVRRLRRESRWTQEELAARSGLDQSTISAVELDKGERTVSTVRGLAAALGGDDIAWLRRAGLLTDPPPAPPFDDPLERLFVLMRARPDLARQVAQAREEMDDPAFAEYLDAIAGAWESNMKMQARTWRLARRVPARP